MSGAVSATGEAALRGPSRSPARPTDSAAPAGTLVESLRCMPSPPTMRPSISPAEIGVQGMCWAVWSTRDYDAPGRFREDVTPMREEQVTSSRKEQDRVRVLSRAEQGRLVGRDAATLVELSVRQVTRLLAGLRREGVAALAHENRRRRPVQATGVRGEGVGSGAGPGVAREREPPLPRQHHHVGRHPKGARASPACRLSDGGDVSHIGNP